MRDAVGAERTNQCARNRSAANSQRRGHASDNYLLWHAAWPRPVFARSAGGDPHALSDDDLAGMDRVLIRIDVDRVYGASGMFAELYPDAAVPRPHGSG
jgi:hypothetical protein